MDRARILCQKDKDMLEAFSRRCIAQLSSKPLFSLSLPFFTSYLDANVRKEIEKDELIIMNAVEDFFAGKSKHDTDVERVFEMTKEIDRNFVKHIFIPSLSLKVRYEDIAWIRKERIACLSRIVHEMLAVWHNPVSFDDVIRKAYTEEHFREVFFQILHLYNLETRQLSHSIRLLPPFSRAVENAAESVFHDMENISDEMANHYSAKLFSGKSS